MAFDKKKFIGKFVDEANEHIDKLNDGLVGLEANPGDQETISEIFRSAHTMKGSSRILGLIPISLVSHKLEDALSAFRDGKIVQSKVLFNLLFKAVDLIAEFVQRVQEGDEVNDDTTEICERLEKAALGEFGNFALPSESTGKAPEKKEEPLSEEIESKLVPIENEKPTEPEPSLELEKNLAPELTLTNGPTPASSYPKPMKFDKKKFIVKFVDEANDHIDKLNDGLVGLEANPGDQETISEIFRSAHTIKGSSRILGLIPISLVAHKLEDALSAFRDGKISQSKVLFNLLFKAVDLIAEFVQRVQEGDEVNDDTTEICERLEKAVSGELEDTVLVSESVGAPSEIKEKPPVENEKPSEHESSLKLKKTPVTELTSTNQVSVRSPSPKAQKPLKKPRVSETVRVKTDKLDETVNLMGEIVSNHIRLKQNWVDINEIGKVSKKYLEAFSGFTYEDGKLSVEDSRKLFEQFQDIYGKLRQLSISTKDVLNFQTLLTDQLREKVLKMRMLPLSTVLDAFPRMVRDISMTCGKEVNFLVEGGETELDKKIIEKIGDPLLHMIRNSVDHGVEPPIDRIRVGKPETGTITLKASYEGGNVLIELRDDGKGIPLNKIKEKAVDKKLFSEEVLNNMTDREIVNLIFRPGFSTSASITDVSGRGVGMDVVRENIIMNLKGSVQVETVEGRGTCFFIRLPLTLAVMRVLLVSVVNYKFALPLHSVKEIVKAHRDQIIKVVDKRAISLRDEIIPIVNLDFALDLPEKSQVDFGEVNIVLVEMGNECLGLVVDTILSEEDMEIKSLPNHMKNNEMVSGATLSGKNEIVLALHIPKLFSIAKDEKPENLIPASNMNRQEVVRRSILVVDDSESAREVQRSILEASGYIVDIAVDGMDGFKMAQENRFDLVISDIEMPRMNGFDFIKKLKMEESYRHTPVIVVSSRNEEAYKRKGMQAGADAFIVKSGFDQSKLLKMVQSLIH
jgi:chemotaxis protein histidine kinase CheA